MTAILTGVRPYRGFDCVSLMICDAEHLFMYLLAVCISSLETFLLRFSAHFKNQIVFDLVLSCMSSLYCGYSPLTRYFSYHIGYVYILLTVSFAVQKLFSLMLSHLFIFVLVASAFGFLTTTKKNFTAKTSVSKLVLINSFYENLSGPESEGS